MEYIIYWDYNEFKNNRIAFIDREIANTVYQAFQKIATNVKAKKPIAIVEFNNNGRRYDYINAADANPGDRLWVLSPTGMKRVHVVDVCERTAEEQTEAGYPMSKLKELMPCDFIWANKSGTIRVFKIHKGGKVSVYVESTVDRMTDEYNNVVPDKSVMTDPATTWEEAKKMLIPLLKKEGISLK